MPVPIKPIPEETKEVPEVPVHTQKQVKVPKASKMKKKLPTPERPQNCVTFGSDVIEIKPTKMMYFRNRTASIYKILKLVPLTEFLAYQKGTFDSDRDSDQILFDFLVAVFDSADIVTKYYDIMTADDFQRILQIFGRLNHITEKEEENRKNREAQATR